MNRAHSLLEESLGEGDWTLNVSKTANVIIMRGGSERDDLEADRQAKRAARCGLLGGTPSRTLLEGEWKYYCCGNWKESDSGTKRMETMRKILEGKGTEEGKRTHVHLLRARCGTVGTDEHGAGCAHLDRVLLGMLRSLSGGGCAPNVERNQTEKKQNMSSVPGLCCRLRTSCKCEGYDGTRAG